jgi:biopolymer transport protein ExbB
MAETTKNPKASNSQEIKPANPFKSWFPIIAILLCAIVCHWVFYSDTGFSAPQNFEGGEEAYEAYEAWVANGKQGEEPAHWTDGHPKQEGTEYFMGIVRKGGFVIPIGLTLHLVLWVFVIERFITISRASGRGNKDVFVKKVRRMLAKGDIDTAASECDKQKGSIGNVIKAGLRKYKEMVAEPGMAKDAKKVAIQAEIEEATMLELPMLERNLSILATIASLGTLVGLIGTVLGMIRAFSALGAGGAPNAAELSVGISEALVNTALGITTSAFAVLFYNFFTTRIDGMTYSMDEAGYSIVQTFDVRH